MDQRRLLLVDANNAFRSALAEQLSQHTSFQIVEAAPAEARSTLTGQHFDVLLVDPSGLMEQDRGLLADWWQAGAGCPILLMGAPEVLSRVHGNLADAVLAKPFRLSSLLEQLRILAVPTAASEPGWTIGPWKFRPRAKLLEGPEGELVRLTEKEVAILCHLHAAPGDLVTREQLLRAVWGYATDVSTHTVETHIYRLRQKIEREPAAARLLLSELGGYRLRLSAP